MTRTLNTILDKLVRPSFSLGGRSWLFFQLFAGTGLVLAVVLMLVLASHSGLSPAVMCLMIVSDIVAGLTLAMITKIILDEERKTYCHLEIAILFVTVALSWLLKQPVLSFLDVSILGLGLGLMCGRLGCLMAGCCHGLPSRCGVRYGPEHVAAGFSPYYGMTRFFPIQIIESMWVGPIVVIGCGMVLRNDPPGAALSFYLCAYGTGRFFFEFVRADTDRAYVWGFSESQWLSFMLMLAVVFAEFLGALPFSSWHVAATVLVALMILAVVAKRQVQREANYQLLLPRHIEEIAQVLDSTSNHAARNGASTRRVGIPIDCTSLGVQISAGRINVAGNFLHHYALSNRGAKMSEASARLLAGLILRIRHPAAKSDLVAGNSGVFHLLVAAP
jgi:hypothetical protein